MRAKVVELYRDWQHALAQYGVTRHTLDLAYELERALVRERQLDPLPLEQLDRAR